MVKRTVVFLILVGLFIAGCNSSVDLSGIANVDFSSEGYFATLDGDTLLIQNEKGLQVIDLTTKQVIKEIPSVVTLGSDISGDTIVWADMRNEKASLEELGDIAMANSDIFVYNIKTGEQKQITTHTSAQMDPKIWQNYVVWQDNRNDTIKAYPGKWSLYLYDLNTGKEQLVTSTLAAHSTYNIRDFRVVWEDDRNNQATSTIRGGDNVPENNKDIYAFSIKDGKETAIATGPLMESRPYTSGDYVVWEERNNGTYDADIVLYNISTQQKTQITKDKFDQADPKIFGDNLVWMDERRGTSTNDVIVNGQPPNSDIFIYNFKTHTEKLLTGDGPQINPSISSNWVAFTLSRQVNPLVQVIRYKSE